MSTEPAHIFIVGGIKSIVYIRDTDRQAQIDTVGYSQGDIEVVGIDASAIFGLRKPSAVGIPIIRVNRKPHHRSRSLVMPPRTVSQP
jgi:hypothetical protein